MLRRMGYRDFTIIVATGLWPVDLCATTPTRQTAHRVVATALAQLNGRIALRSCVQLRLPRAPVPARAKVTLLGEVLDVRRLASVMCSVRKQPRRPEPKRTHKVGCA